MHLTRPAWVEVNLDNLRDNMRTIKSQVSDGVTIISVVKSDAYGYGAYKVVETLKEEGINYFAVATLSEAISLRRKFKDIELLILGYSPDYLMEDAIKNNVTMTIYNMESAERINSFAEKMHLKAKVTIAVESGMNRIGFKPTEENANIIKKIYNMPNINITGIFTHFAAADTDREYTEYQFSNYMKMIEMLKNRNVEIPLRHVNNSQGVINYREYDLTAVRPGLVGLGHTEGVESKYPGFKVDYIGQVKAQIANLKVLPAGEKISYGLTYETDKETRIATIPLGYADGIIRQLSNKIDVLISGKRCKQVGRICMDQFMVDVTGVECKIGDEVVIIGKQGEEEIPILEVALKAGEIATSYSCHFSKRLPRVYIKNGKVDSVYDGILDEWYSL